jgi:ACT domain-containing protein
MALSDFEIGKIAEIVAGKVGAELDAKTLRQVIDRVVDSMQQQRGNPDIKGGTCETARGPSSPIDPSAQKNTPRVLPPDQEMISAKGGLYEQIEKTDRKRVIIAAFGKDRPGVAAALTAVLAENNCSIEDISQTVMQDYFSMIMIVNIAGSTLDFSALRDKIQATETQLGMKVYIMHEDIFRYMHRI